MNWSNHCHFVM